MKVHQLITDKKFTLRHRVLSCFCRNLGGRCDCHSPNLHSFEEDEESSINKDKQYILDEVTGNMSVEYQEANMSDLHEDMFDDDAIYIRVGDGDYPMGVNGEVSLSDDIDTHYSDSGLHPQKKFVAKKKRYIESEDDSDAYSVHDSSEGSIILEDTIEDSIEETSEPEDNSNEEERSTLALDINSYILVKFRLEKRNKYYIGQIVEVIDSYSYKVKFLRNKGNCKFAWPITDDISLITKDDIENVIPTLLHERRGIKTFDILNFNYKIE